MNVIRQGDLVFLRQELSSYTLERVQEKEPEKRGVIAEGEATGHHHRIAVLEDAQVFHLGNDESYLRVGPNGVAIVHEEHHPVRLTPGDYKVNRAREFSYLDSVARTVPD
jgi:hypothetical protein